MSLRPNRPSGLAGAGASRENARPAPTSYPAPRRHVNNDPDNPTRPKPAASWPAWTDELRYTVAGGDS